VKGRRCWVGHCQYDGKEKFYLGTVEADSEMDAMVKLKALWEAISPHPFPSFVVCIPGAIILQLEGDPS
jgi:hypothetical protein